ncbi:inovirus Gp2 family protein [Pseudoalteromonas fenneropenaei]|uniref:Inovirus Gp2 family protein n=1 Tax=Pseudoalteromonas fenneropenaei TaxID=1737459 RepID=A0ABV7CPK7_9GAMM
MYNNINTKTHTKTQANIITNPYDKNYKVLKETMGKIEWAVDEALSAHPRLTGIRFDLHIPPSCLDPEGICFIGSGVMKRFFSSLQAKIKASHKFKSSKQVQHLRYVWVKEYGEKSNRPHYHVCIFLNKDNFQGLGDIYAAICSPKFIKKSLAQQIIEAWASALKIEYSMSCSHVHFPENPKYWVDTKNETLGLGKLALLTRLSYLAKPNTKVFGIGEKTYSDGKYLIYTPPVVLGLRQKKGKK